MLQYQSLAHTFRRRPNKAQQEQARGSVIGGKLQPGALGVHIKTHTNFTAVIVMRTHSHQGNGQIPPMVIHNHQKRGGGQQAKALWVYWMKFNRLNLSNLSIHIAVCRLLWIFCLVGHMNWESETWDHSVYVLILDVLDAVGINLEN